MTTDSRIITISDNALTQLLEVRSTESDADDLALVLSITGTRDLEFTYAMHMTRTDQLDPLDHVEHHGSLPVAMPPDSVSNLRGAFLGVSANLLKPGLKIDNPNSPSPRMFAGDDSPDLSEPIASQVDHVIRHQINPAIAAHGGSVSLAGVDDGVAYVRLGGGCQGCGLAGVTLSQGIETAIVAAVPDVHKVLDVTDHASGDNPYYEQSKK
ncbi:MAG: NifU family protein [Actinomycetia bacterium]|nr:NifU family protein [Actinomycetes bacterium]